MVKISSRLFKSLSAIGLGNGEAITRLPESALKVFLGVSLKGMGVSEIKNLGPSGLNLNSPAESLILSITVVLVLYLQKTLLLAK